MNMILLMIEEIKKLGLPKGRWQELARKLLIQHELDRHEAYVYYPDANSLEFVIGEIAKFRLSFMPGCRGVLISHGTFVNPKYRGYGLSYILQQIKQVIAKDLLVAILIATVRSDNDPQIKVVKKSGWKKVFSFTNKRSNNEIDFIFLITS